MSCWAPNAVACVLVIQKQRTLTQTEKGGSGTTEAEIGVMGSLVKECQQPAEAARNSGQILLSRFWKE